jgi:hypothetical protein
LKNKISIVLIFFMFVSLFYGCTSSTNITPETPETVASEVTDPPEPSEPEPEPKENLVTEEEPSIREAGAEVIFSSFDLENELTVNISKTEPEPLTFEEEITEDYLLEVYEINVSEQENFIDLIEIRLDYDASFIEEGADESRSTFAMYFNPDSSTWETVDYWVDTDNKQVVVTTSHLSKYGVFTVKNENTRLAYIGRVNSYKKIVDSDMAAEIINEAINRPKGESQKSIELGMNIANDWLGLSGFLLTTSNPIYATEFLEGLGTAFNGLGIAAATVQVAVDFQSGDNVALYGNLTKNMMNIAISNWGTSALQLSFAGVFAIDYSLNKFANAAWDGRKEIWYDAYNLHYKEKMTLKPRQWYSKFYWIWQDSIKEKDPQYLKDQINHAINANVNAFWQNESTMAFYQGEVMDNGATGGGGINEDLKREITDVKRAELAKSLQPVFNQLEKRITYYLRDQYRKQLEATKREFNKIINVSIEEVVPEGMPANYADYIVKFAPLSEDAKANTWIGKLNENGSAKTKFTLLGHLQSGQPNTIELYAPDADLETDSPEKIIDFKISGTELTIKIGDYPPLEALTGPWPGTFFFDSVQVPDPKPQAVVDETDETEESCDGFDVDLDEIFQSLKAQEGKSSEAIINITQLEENRGFLWFGDDSEDLEEDEKLYFNYNTGQIQINKSQDGFTLTTNLRAMYVAEEKIRLFGPVSLTGMNGTLDIRITFESER